MFKIILPIEFGTKIVNLPQFGAFWAAAVSLNNVKLVEYFLSFTPDITMNQIITLSSFTANTYDLRNLIVIPSRISLQGNFDHLCQKNTKFDDKDQTISVPSPNSQQLSSLLTTRTYRLAPYNWIDMKNLSVRHCDKYYADRKLESEYDETMDPEVLEVMRGEGEKHGIFSPDWDFFNNESNYDNFIYVGGNGCEKDGQCEEFIDKPLDDGYFQGEEFKYGVKFLSDLFQSNKNLEPQKQSPYLTILELFIRNFKTKKTSPTFEDLVSEFLSIFLDSNLFPLSFISTNYIFFSIIREFFPSRPIPISAFFKMYHRTSIFDSINSKIWFDDIIFDTYVEMIGAVEHKKLINAYNGFLEDLSKDHDWIEYSKNRDLVINCQDGRHDGRNVEPDEIKNVPEMPSTPSTPSTPSIPTQSYPLIKTNQIWNFQQYVFLKNPITMTSKISNLLFSLLMCLTMGYLDSLEEKTSDLEGQFAQAVQTARKNGTEEPDAPQDGFKPASHAWSSARLQSFVFNQMQMIPQFYLRLCMNNTLYLKNHEICGDFYDMFLFFGGDFFQTGTQNEDDKKEEKKGGKKIERTIPIKYPTRYLEKQCRFSPFAFLLYSSELIPKLGNLEPIFELYGMSEDDIVEGIGKFSLMQDKLEEIAQNEKTNCNFREHFHENEDEKYDGNNNDEDNDDTYALPVVLGAEALYMTSHDNGHEEGSDDEKTQ